ncbi:MAG: cytochrome c oxidase assembly protein [Streptosporangiaceae bacterium]|nr:cytochrome c oxidase assembly protein [Streptosporangiaceae bacterium]
MPALTPHSAFTTWQFLPLVTALLILSAAGYLYGVRAVQRRHPARPWPAARTAAFLAGLAVIAVATQSSVGAYDDVLFSVHMIQHLLLIMVAPPLLVFGRPVTLALHAARNPVHTWIKRAIRSRIATALTWPPFAVTLYAVVVTVTHLTPLRELVLENPALHAAEHALYLVTGYLYFLPVIGAEPLRWRPSLLGRYLLLLVAMVPDTAVGVILMSFVQSDLHEGGLIMLAGSDLIMTALAMALAASLVWSSEIGAQQGQVGG